MRLITAVVVLIAAAAFAGTVQAANTRPAGIAKADYRALMLRSEALNQRYGLRVVSGRPEGMSAPEYRALIIRSKALNTKYAVARRLTRAAAQRTPVNSDAGFPWLGVAVVAGAMFGLLLVGAGLLAVRRSRSVAGADTSPATR